jgi:ribosomal protein L37AE/L43A
VILVGGERWSSGLWSDRSCGRRGAGGAGERFTEGFDTLDLKEAKALLDELHV